MKNSLTLEFENIEPLMKSRFIKELEEQLLREDPTISMEIISEKGNQDLGTILQVVLTAPSIIIIAKGISDYLRRRNNATVLISSQDKEITATGVTSNTVLDIIKEINEHSAQKE